MQQYWGSIQIKHCLEHNRAKFRSFNPMKKMGCFPHFKSTNFDNSFFPFYAILKRLEFGCTVWKWGNFGVVTATLQNIKEVGGITMSELKSYQQRCLKHNVKLALFRLCEAAGSPISLYFFLSCQAVVFLGSL